MDPQEEALKKGILPYSEGWGEEDPKGLGTFLTHKNGLTVEGKVTSIAGDYTEFYTQLFESVRNQAPLAVRPEEALQGLQIIEAAYESHSHKRAVFV